LKEAGQELAAHALGDFTVSRAKEAAREMFDKPDHPDAVFVVQDSMAFAVMDVLRGELNIKIPQEVSIIGYDDVPPASLAAYDLTTMRQRSNIMVDETVAPQLCKNTERMDLMKGFSDQFKDFPDYILGITKEIWEDRGLASLNHYYSKDIPVRSPGSIVFGNEGVIAATMSTLAEFPDRRLLGEDVIWSGSPEEL